VPRRRRELASGTGEERELDASVFLTNEKTTSLLVWPSSHPGNCRESPKKSHAVFVSKPNEVSRAGSLLSGPDAVKRMGVVLPLQQSKAKLEIVPESSCPVTPLPVTPLTVPLILK
jgi:hypothetical protein